MKEEADKKWKEMSDKPGKSTLREMKQFKKKQIEVRENILKQKQAKLQAAQTRRKQ